MSVFVLNDNGKAESRPSCIIKMDNEATRVNDFVTVAIEPSNGNVIMLSYADPLLLGQAMKMITDEFHQVFQDLTEEQQMKIMEVLGK